MDDMSPADPVSALTPTGQLNDGTSSHEPAMSAPGSQPAQDAVPFRNPEQVGIEAQEYGRTHLVHGDEDGHVARSWNTLSDQRDSWGP
jgi:hypothetical protein